MQEKQTPRFGGQLGSFFELSAKAVAVFTAMALATAFVFDSLYYGSLDIRLLSVFGLSDHIETAVYCLPPIIIVAAFLFAGPLIGEFSTSALDAQQATAKATGSKVRKTLVNLGHAVIVIYVLVGIGWLVVLFITKDDQRWIWLATASAGLVVAGAQKWLARGSSSLSESFRKRLLIVPPLWLALTIGIALGTAVVTKLDLKDKMGSPFVADTVLLGDNGQLFGKVIRFVDRGVILGKSDPVRFMFVPKEKVSRVDLVNPLNE